MPTYVYNMRLIAVNMANYSDSITADFQQSLSEIAEEHLTVTRDGAPISISEWGRDFELEIEEGLAGNTLLEAIDEAAEARARELGHGEGVKPVPLSVRNADSESVKALADFYCVPPRPPECYHSFVLFRNNEEVPVELPSGDRAGRLAVLLSIRPLA